MGARKLSSFLVKGIKTGVEGEWNMGRRERKREREREDVREKWQYIAKESENTTARKKMRRAEKKTKITERVKSAKFHRVNE